MGQFVEFFQSLVLGLGEIEAQMLGEVFSGQHATEAVSGGVAVDNLIDMVAPQDCRVTEDADQVVQIRIASSSPKSKDKRQARQFMPGDAQIELIPYMFVVGLREAQQRAVSVRHRREGDLGATSLEAALGRLKEEIASKAVR